MSLRPFVLGDMCCFRNFVDIVLSKKNIVSIKLNIYIHIHTYIYIYIYIHIHIYIYTHIWGQNTMAI